MSGDPSAFEALGLRPGADRAAIERAYKALIKIYHPDRQGGNAARASEINEAYFHLRKSVAPSLENIEPVSFAEAIYARRPRRTRKLVPRRKKKSLLWPLFLLVLAQLVYLRWVDLAAFGESGLAQVRAWIEPPRAESGRAEAMHINLASLDGPLERSAIAVAVKRAVALQASGDEAVLVDESGACHQKLRSAPSLARLDACAAFDNAVIELQRSDPLANEGPFGAPALAARQISAATLLSKDYLAIDRRLDRVRHAVQSLLALPPAAVEPLNGAKVSR